MPTKTKAKSLPDGQLDHHAINEFKDVPIRATIEENKKIMEELFKDSSDIVLREFDIENGPKAMLCYVDGMVTTSAVDDALKALMILEGNAFSIDRITEQTLPVTQASKIQFYKELLTNLLSGDSVLFVDEQDTAVCLGLRGGIRRSVSEPETETVVRGPREGFNEHLRTNTSLLRSKIKSPRLKLKSFVIGTETNTNVVLAYMAGIVNPKLLEEAEKRISRIHIDGVLESGYIEEFIQDQGYSPFPQVQTTERPDTVAAGLLEGRIAIMVDGTPFALLAPFGFWQWLQASEDYYERFMATTLLRWLRLGSLFVALLAPAIYIAVSTFHPEMIPTNLLLSIAASREAIPFPAVVEALIMELSFEALREAGVRLPKIVGQAVSILGALVVGQAAVQAGIVSAAMVIVVSMTGIASFTLPRYNAAIAIRMLRFPIMILASIFGLLGIIIGVMVVVGHLAKLTTFGIPYLAPVTPVDMSDMKDVMVRAPWWKMKKRPKYMGTSNVRRQRPEPEQ
ncbi:spore germination protein [Paenibacillus glycanilyticus]|uniref:Membrane protein YfkQ n=1 Tax=Paenibacillus glycanilyticus TaxID=126569 RepID=A0ABQ6GGV8_9BACL|nr:spore germination protein [Paenibacillus glycanilyticus]GLX68867.1 putative membrane protein YfkQ [Paenibacillus glycanilyticus]